MGMTHATVEPDGTPNFHFAARPVIDFETARRTAFTDRDFGRRSFGQPRHLVYDPESELRDPDVQKKRSGLR